MSIQESTPAQLEKDAAEERLRKMEWEIECLQRNQERQEKGSAAALRWLNSNVPDRPRPWLYTVCVLLAVSAGTTWLLACAYRVFTGGAS